MFSINNVKLHFTDSALTLIAKKAIAKNTGARGLRAILENILMEPMFEIPDAKSGENPIDVVLVDEEAVGSSEESGMGAKIVRRNGELEPSIYNTESRDIQEKEDIGKADLEGEMEISSNAMSL